MGAKHWSAADKQALCALYPETSNEILSRLFGRPAKAICLMAIKLGVKKSARYMAEEAARIKPGQEPWNKGVSFNPGGGSVATRFQSGNKPQTWVPVGSTKLNKDGNLVRKVADTGDKLTDWVPAHKFAWESVNGPTPPGHIVVFRPGMHTTDSEQITIDRVECITRAENMRRNTYLRYGPEVAKLIQLRGAINRQIRKKEREHEHQ